MTVPLRISLAGSSALLLDAAEGVFSDSVQRRIWAMAHALAQDKAAVETVPGMNNLLVVFDPLATDTADLQTHLRTLWTTVDPGEVVGRAHTIPVVYGGARGEDLQAWATHCGFSVEEAVRRHADATYTVAAVGAMPGFPYLSGLDPRLAWSRRASPRAKVPEGSVIIGATQAAVMPLTAPSGWHILGHADVKLFDAGRSPPALLQPGDTVRFAIAGIEA